MKGALVMSWQTVEFIQSGPVGFINWLGPGGLRKLDVVFDRPSVAPSDLATEVTQQITSTDIMPGKADKTVRTVWEPVAWGKEVMESEVPPVSVANFGQNRLQRRQHGHAMNLNVSKPDVQRGGIKRVRRRRRVDDNAWPFAGARDEQRGDDERDAAHKT